MKRKINILLVEDQILIAMNEKENLEEYGYNVSLVHSGEQAIDFVKENPDIDAILMDIDLGRGIDGTEAAKRILAEKDFPVVFLSSHVEPEIVNKSENITSYGYVVKNSGITVINASIKMALKLFKANNEIKEREKRYESLFEKNHSIVLLVDPETGMIKDANSSACSFYGYSREKLISMNIDKINMLSNEEIKKEMQKAKEETRNHYEFDHKLANGEIRNVEVYVGPIEIAGESLLYSIIHDVTKKHRLEAKQNYLLNVLKRTSKMVQTGGWEYDVLTGKVGMTDQIVDIFEIDHTDLENVNKLINQCYTKDSIKIIDYSMKKAIQEGLAYDIELELISRKGNRKWVQSVGEPILKSGKVVRIVGSLQEITKRKIYEKALEESEENLSLTLQSIGDAVIVTDCDGKVVRLNLSAEKLTGWKMQEAEGKLLDKVFNIINGKTRKPVENPVKKVLRDGKTIGLANDTILISKNKKEFQISDSAAPILDKKGKIYGTVLVFRDVSKEYSLHTKLENERKRLKEAQRMAGLGYWYWDLKTNDVVWSDEVYKMFGQDPKNFKPCIETIKALSPWPESQEIFYSSYEYVQKSRKQSEYDEKFLRPDGTVGYYHSIYKGVYDEQGNAIGMEGTTIDISRNKTLEIVAKQSETLITAILDNLPIGIAVNSSDENNDFKYMNSVFSDLYVSSGKSKSDLISFCKDLIKQKDLDENIKKEINEFLAGTGRKEYFWKDILFEQEQDVKKYISVRNAILEEHSLSLSCVWDVTHRKKIETELVENNNFSDALLNSSPDVVYLYDLIEKKNIYSNDGIVRVLGFTAEDMQKKGSGLLEWLMHPDDFQLYVNDTINKYPSMTDDDWLTHEYRMRDKSGEWHWLMAKEKIFSRNPDNSPKQIFGIVTDISEKKAKDEKILNLLEEKEIILREVHHRIKNNMNVIITLLSLQSNLSEDPNVVSVFNDAIGRIKTIFVLYDKLHISENYSEISISVYLKQLIGDIKKTLFQNVNVDITMKIEDFKCSAHNLPMIGIVINELFTNSLKHAFDDNEEGKIEIKCKKTSSHLQIVYKDNGKKIKDPEEIKSKEGFGLNLINMILKQLKGELEISAKSGLKFKIRISTEKYKKT